MRDEIDTLVSTGGPSYRVSRARPGMEPNTKRLALIAGGIGGTLLLLVGAYSMSGHRHPAGVPVVEADSRPLRVKPVNPGGLEVYGSDDSILSGAAFGKEAMAPLPEVPAPQVLKAEEARDAAARLAETQPILALADAAAPQATVPQAAATQATEPASLVVPTARPTPALPAPVARTAPPVLAPTFGGATQVQLAALLTEEAAMSEWQRLAHKMPDLLASRRPAVSRTEREGKTFFRLRTGGFTDVAQATTFCQHVREKGVGCSIASF